MAPRLLRNGLLAAGCIVLANGAADAQTSSGGADGSSLPVSTPQTATYQRLSDGDATALRSVLDAARSGDAQRMRGAMTLIQDPLARKLALWALADNAPDSLSFFEADAARRDLAGWPRGAKRQASAEKLLETSGLTPDRIVAWFGDGEPATAEGAMALASAYRMTGHEDKAADLIRHWWRDEVFEADPQRTMLARFGGYLSVEDHIQRADLLLYGPQGPAAQDMVALLPEPYRSLGNIRIGLRNGSPDANARAAELPFDQATSPGVAFEKAAFLRRRDLEMVALPLVKYFPTPPNDDAAARIWAERKALVGYAMKAGDWKGAYQAAANSGMTFGVEAAEAEFYAGWIALSKLRDPALASKHFAILAQAGTSPITRGRALYWEGRAAEAGGDPVGAQVYYAQGAEHITTFYGQLAAEKAGITKIDLGHDPQITAADRARFESRETVRAARALAQIGNDDLFRVFVLHIDDTLPTAEEEAQLVDMARMYSGPSLAMRAARTAAMRGFILPERGYPLVITPAVNGGAEQAFVLSITRQESNFDPMARSGVGARGMMQLMPATAKIVARRIGEPYSPDRLHDAVYNMRLGSSYLGQLVDQFSGSYVMAAAGYNAGPGRPMQWSSLCGDPRGALTDAVDFIECIPFSETRNYVMRTLETTQVYRARLNGQTAPLVLSADLNRGGYGSYAANTVSDPP